MRSFTLPHSVDKDNIQAEMHEGVLQLTVPKREEEPTHRIPVRTTEEGAKEPRQIEAMES
jgi:HSP20 family molecular chaperone IbpA